MLDTKKLAADVQANITALEKSPLTPLLGFALTNLRGALGAIEGHNAKAPEITTKAPAAAPVQ